MMPEQRQPDIEPQPPAQPLVKPWYLSKTIWFNITLVVVLVATELANVPRFTEYRDEILLIATIGNIIIRVFFTQTALTR